MMDGESGDDGACLVCTPSQYHQRALRAAINRLPADWQRPRGRPRRPRPPTTQLGVEVGTGPFKMASTCRDIYAH